MAQETGIISILLNDNFSNFKVKHLRLEIQLHNVQKLQFLRHPKHIAPCCIRQPVKDVRHISAVSGKIHKKLINNLWEELQNSWF
jgi:hypothetical protein